MFKRRAPLFVLAVVVLALCAVPAFANYIATANATVTCSGYSLSVSAADLTPGENYTIVYTIDVSPSAPGFPITGSIPFTASATTFTGTVNGSFSPALAGSYVFSGTATLEEHNTVDIAFSPSTVSCPTQPPPPPCATTRTNPSNFNGTSVPAGTYIWFNSNFKASNVPSSGVTIDFTDGNVAFKAGGTSYSLAVPNARITFSPSATCTSTTFDSMTNTWVTTVPVSGDDEIFLTGFAWPVPTGGLAPGANPVNFTGTYSSETNAPGLSIQMVWSAAAYSKFTTDYNSLQIKAGHQTACGQSNGDHAGTPEGTDNTDTPWKKYLVGGPRGGGGSNFTGSWSGTLAIPICPHP